MYLPLHVRHGRRIQLANWSGKVTSGDWHELRAEFQGDHVEVYWDGTKRIDAHDPTLDRKSTRLNSSHSQISYAVFCLKKKKKERHNYCMSTHQRPENPKLSPTPVIHP